MTMSDIENYDEEEVSVTNALPFKVIGVAHTLDTQKHLEHCFEKNVWTN